MNKIIKNIYVTLIIMLLLFITGCKRKYKVEFLNSNGTIIETQKVLKGDKIQCSSEPLKEGYIFIGWYLDGDFCDLDSYTVSKNIKLVAKWEKGFKITFDSVGGTKIDDLLLSVNDGIINLSNEEFITKKEGYEFLGWYFNDKKVYNLEVRDYETEYIAKSTLDKYVAKGWCKYTFDRTTKEITFEVLDKVNCPYISIIDVKTSAITGSLTSVLVKRKLDDGKDKYLALLADIYYIIKCEYDNDVIINLEARYA